VFFLATVYSRNVVQVLNYYFNTVFEYLDGVHII